MGLMKTNVSSALRGGPTDSPENERAALRHNFLRSQGLDKVSAIPLPADASQRCYFRLPNKLLMDAPPPHESTLSFQIMAETLRDAGLNVPRIYASDHENGLLLIEDLGRLTFREAFQRRLSEDLLYGEVINALTHLHKNVFENKSNLSFYSPELFLREVDLFLEWYGLFFSPQEKEDFRGLWTEAYHHQPPLPHSLVMRDVMFDNLIWVPSREGFRRCGFIDFQDGVWGPITYDLVSLVEDARRDITPQFSKDMIEIYFKSFPDLNQQDFWASYNLWGAQRCTKILGIFSRLAKRDNKPHYLPHLSRVRALLQRNLSHPSLRALQKWFQAVNLW